MKHVLSQLMFTGFVLALYFVIQVLRKREMKYKENRLFVFACIFSSLWSFGFFGVNIQTNPDNGYLWRGIGLVGTFGFLITAQFLICHLSDVKKIYCYLTEGFSLLGILIFFFIIQRDHAVYELSSIGMSYSFPPTFWNNFYNVYCVIVGCNMVAMIMYMIKRPRAQRLKELGKNLMWVISAMIFGMLLDTILPMFGTPSVPGSTIGQFVGLVVLYVSLSSFNLSRITISNMSEFIYYSLTVPVMVFDVKEKLQILNDTAYSFLGVEREKMSELTLEDIFDISNTEAFEFSETSQSIDAICVNTDKYCNLSVNKIFDNYEDKIGYIIIVTDLSERMRTMKRLEEAIKEAEHASKAKSVFLANMSHEIRTPMNAIVGFSELLLKMDIDREVRSHVEDIKFSSNNLLAIINDILDISKIESGKMELVNDNYFMATLLSDVALIVGYQAQKKGLNFEVHVDETIPKTLYGDNVRIRSVLINILNNAVKYTDEGYVKFEVSILSRTDNRIKLSFKVTDTGTGIKEENIKKLFDHFERFDQKIHYGVEGSGLGLAISKGYVNLMNGEIKVESTYGKGSVFTVEIEQDIVDDSPIEKDYLRGREHLGEYKPEKFIIKDTRVLVVDDNPVNIKVAQGIFGSYGLEVDTVLSGMESIEMCRDKKYDLVFMDQMMPGMDGLEAMHHIRNVDDHYKSGGEGKIIVLTANAIKGIREQLMQEGFDEYLGKPMSMAQLERLFYRFIPEERFVYNQGEEMNTLEGTNTKNDDINKLHDLLPNVDIEFGMSHCGGQVEDYLRVMEITYKYGKKQIKELGDLLESKDYKNYGIKVHSLKSTTLNIGAKDVSAEAKAQELAAHESDFAYIDANYDKLKTEFTELLGEIERVLAEFGIIETPEEDSSVKKDSVLDERLILHMLSNIENQIDNFDFAQVFSILEEAQKCQLPPQYTELIQKISVLMDDLNVDEVKALIAQTKNK